MAELPSGTVTLLFSDIEGSTALVRALGDAWPSVLQRQRDLARAAWAAHGGHELGTEGDSFFVVFSTAAAAVSAALDLQRVLAAEAWPDGAVVRVRVGIHTGSPQRHAEGYVGLDVHKAARVAASAHGGQVVISDPAAQLLGEDMPAGAGLLDLGVHRLKDISAGIRLHQLTAPDLERVFAPVKTLGGAGSLPAALSPILGRDGEIAELVELLGVGRARLVTLTGPGGAGKTRLATEVAAVVARRFEDGVFFVAADTVTRGADMWPAIAQALDLPVDAHLPPAFFEHIVHRRVLLVLDNLEQVPDAADVVRALLETADHVTVLATSRRPLHVEAEFDHAVPPLVLPRPARSTNFDEVAASGAVQMFCEHARRVRSNFTLTADNATDIAAICRALDGLPLAIELAAVRVKVLSPKAIAARIGDALDLASPDRTRETRRRTVRDTIGWSYDLLTPAQQQTLTILSVFEGGADLDAITTVSTLIPDGGGVDLLETLFDLADASLVTITETDDGEPWFGLLQTVHRFALDALHEQNRYQAAVTAHAQYYYDLTRTVRHDFLSQGLGRTLDEEQARRIQSNLANLHAVIERGAIGVVEPLIGTEPLPPRQAAALLVRAPDWIARYRDVLAFAEVLLTLPADTVGTASALATTAFARLKLGERQDCIRDARSARSLVQALVEPDLHETTHPASWLDPAAITASVLTTESLALMENGDLDQAAALAEQASELAAGHPAIGQDQIREARAWIARAHGDFDTVRREFQAMTRRSDAWMANTLADMDLNQGNLRQAQTRLAEAIRHRAFTDPELTIVTAETMAAVIGHQHAHLCARTYGCTHTAREVEDLPNGEFGDAQDEKALAPIKRLITPAEWDTAFDHGRTETLTDLVQEMAALPLPDTPAPGTA